MHTFETAVIEVARTLFDHLGWLGVVVAMAIESACIPFPSEVIMPLAGWLLVAEHGLGWAGVAQAAVWGAVGNLIGSVLAYWVGARGGRPLLERYGRWILVTRADLDRADRWFARWGEATVFLARLVPVVRTFISLPAGVVRMPFGRFALFTFAGSFLWSFALAAVGYQWGPRWEQFRERARFLDYPIAAVVLLLVALYLWHKLRDIRRESAQARTPLGE
jgi:membrane protein DedA with SNARE-associated domain